MRMRVARVTVSDAVLTIEFDDGGELRMTRWEWDSIHRDRKKIQSVVSAYLRDLRGENDGSGTR